MNLIILPSALYWERKCDRIWRINESLVEYHLGLDNDLSIGSPALLYHLGYRIFLPLLLSFLLAQHFELVLGLGLDSLLHLSFFYVEFLESVKEQPRSIVKTFLKVHRMLLFLEFLCFVEVVTETDEVGCKGMDDCWFIGLTFLFGLFPDLLWPLEVLGQFDSLFMDDLVPSLSFSLLFLDLHGWRGTCFFSSAI